MYWLKVGFSPSKQNCFYLLQRKPIKNDENSFLFHLKSSFRSQDLLVRKSSQDSLSLPFGCVEKTA